MIYTSKRRKFKDFLKTRNWSYYFIFLVLFATVITCVFIGINKANKSKQNNETTAEFASSDITTTPTKDNMTTKGRYKIAINLSNHQISIYEWNQSKKDYSSDAIKYMTAGVNIKLVEGSYFFDEENFDKSNWYTTSSGDIYRYYTEFSDDFTFHTARYQEHNNKNSLDVVSYNTIGETVNSSGITLLCSDAKWIYENCSYSSEIFIYSDAAEPINENITVKLAVPNGLSWDPTDTSNGSTFCQTKVSDIHCVYDFVNITQFGNVDFVKNFVKATDELGNDISSYVFTDISGTFDTVESMEMTFYVADIYGNVISDTILVNVVPNEQESESESVEEETTEVSNEPVTEPTTEPTTEPLTEPTTAEPVTEPTIVNNETVTSIETTTDSNIE